MSDNYEICEIKSVVTKKSGWFGKTLYVFIANNVTTNTIIAETNEIEYSITSFYKDGKPVLRTLVNSLMTEGWEKVGNDEPDLYDFSVNDATITLRRKITKSNQANTNVALITQLKALYEANILTEEEYTIKKAEILKRM